MNNPSEKHLRSLVHLLQYVRSTAAWDLCFDRVPDFVVGADFVFYTYCDSPHADNPDTMCSTGGYYIFLGRGQGAVCGKTFAAKSPALSSTEAEYICAAEAAKDSIWVKQFLDELNLFGKVQFELMEDSKPCINALKEDVSDSRFRHVRIYYHFLRDFLNGLWCAMVYISTDFQLAGLCTKLLPSKVTKDHSMNVLGIRTERL